MRATSPETVFTVSLSTVTSIVSLRPPTSSAKSAVTRPSATSTKPDRSAFLKPWISALTLYVPRGRLTNTYAPWASVVAVRE